MKNKLGVVLVTYNRLHLLKEAIEAINCQTVAFSKIVIVNNCSTDGTKEYLAKFQSDDRFEILNMDENLGGAGGFAVGIEKMNCFDMDWVLIIDDDAMIAHDYNQQLMKYIEKHEHVNACSGVVTTNNKITTVHRRRLSNKLLFVEKEVNAEEYKKESFHCDLATFCGLMIRGEIMREIGVPNKDYFIWYDDTEYCLRLKKYGGIVNVNAAVLNHKTKETKSEGNYFSRTNWKYYYGQRNRLDTARKHFGGLTALMVYLEMIVFLMATIPMHISSKTREKAKYNFQMIADAIGDARHHVLGKNIKYVP